MKATFVSFEGLSDQGEHVAVACGDWRNLSSPLVRIHSECLTGDVFGSARCDCGPQLQEALERISKEGGVVLYLRQEGRGIGLYNKLKAYVLQDQGLDTFQANHALAFPEDSRSFEVAAQMLKALGIDSVQLHSNNPEKEKQLKLHGIGISQIIPTGVFQTQFNFEYLKSKANKKGHTLILQPADPEDKKK